MTLVIALFAPACSSDRTFEGEFAGAKIAFLFIGERDDLGYNQATWEGADAVAEAFPDNEVVRVEKVPETEEAVAQMERLIDDGARILFPTSFGHLEYAMRVAERHPDVIVLHQGGVEPEPGLDNFGTYWGTVYEPVYLAGIAAGAATTSGVLGFVAAFAIPATFNNVNAFTLGARVSNPSAVTHVVFTDDWCAPDRQREAAAALLASGADVLTQHQDCTRTVLDAAETAGVNTIGYHADGSEAAPGSWLAGSVWVWDDLFVDMVRTVLDGDFASSEYQGNYRGSLSTGDNPFTLTELAPSVGPEPRAAIAQAEADFRNGGSPFRGPLVDNQGRTRVAAGAVMTQEEIDATRWFVEGVVSEPEPTSAVPASGD